MARARGRGARLAAAAACALLAISYAAVLVPRAVTWRDPVRLWTAKAEEDPGSLKAELNLGRALAARGDVAGAREAYERAARIAPEMAAMTRAEFESLAGSETEAEALAGIRAALEATPGDGALWSNLGFRLLEAGDFAGASEAFQKAVTLVPTRSHAWLGLALAMQRLGRPPDAEAAARSALAIRPDLPLARMILAECALRRGSPCEALEVLDGAEFEVAAEIAAKERILDLARAACPGGP
jgi:superkiller protein 3